MSRLLLLLVFLTSVLKAQDSTHIYIKTQPLLLIDPYNGSLATLGAEFTIKNWGFYTEGGLYTPLNTAFNKNPKGFMIKEEVKWYLFREKTRTRFISAEFCYSQMTCTRTDEIIYSAPDTSYNKTYQLSRKFPGFVLQYGFMRTWKTGFLLEFSLGLGLRYNQVTCTLNEEEAEHRNLGDWNAPSNYIYRCGNHLIHKFNFSLKLGWRIR